MSRTGKQRSERIEIDYYRRQDDLYRWRRACIVVALLLALGYAVFALLPGNAGSQLSTGTISAAHAHFEQRCDECHQDFTPIDAQASQISLPQIGIVTSKSLEHIETSCSSCHTAGTHHRELMNETGQQADQNCASCHQEHQGRDMDLALVANDNCIGCHQSLSSVCRGASTIQNSVTSFTADTHPSFASLMAGDPGRIKFDHAQHMLPGQVADGQRGALRLNRLPEHDRSRYRTAGEASDLVQLQCADCHRPAGIPASSGFIGGDVEQGRYFEQISFEQHCQACHAISPGINSPNTTPLPHAQPWNQIDLLLAANLEGARRLGLARSAGDDSQSTPQVGEGPGGDDRNVSLETTTGELAAARQLVAGQCEKCHLPDDCTDSVISAALSSQRDPLIPSRWLQHGLFDHGAHRDMNCIACHPGAAADRARAGEPAGDQDVVMINNIESCVECHRADDAFAAAQTKTKDGMPAHASDRCTLCHRYHTPQVSGGQLYRFTRSGAGQ